MTTDAAAFCIPKSAKTKIELQNWANTNSTAVRYVEWRSGQTQLFAILADVGSGLTRENIYLYTFEEGQWRLVLVRMTNTQVTAKLINEEIVFSGSDGALLLKQPIASIRVLASSGPTGQAADKANLTEPISKGARR